MSGNQIFPKSKQPQNFGRYQIGKYVEKQSELFKGTGESFYNVVGLQLLPSGELFPLKELTSSTLEDKKEYTLAVTKNRNLIVKVYFTRPD